VQTGEYFRGATVLAVASVEKRPSLAATTTHHLHHWCRLRLLATVKIMTVMMVVVVVMAVVRVDRRNSK